MVKVDAAPPAQRPHGIRWWLALVALVSGACSIGLIFTALTPVLPRLSAHFGGSGPMAGEISAQMVMSVPAIGLILGGACSGWIIERVGARRLLLGALMLYALAGSAGLWLDNLPLLFVSRAVTGFGAACISTAVNSFIGELFDDKGRGRMLSVATVVGSLFATAAILLSGWFGETSGWRGPFALYLIVPAVLFVAALALPAIPARRGHAAGAASGMFRQLWPIFLMIAALYVVLMMTSTQISFLLQENGVDSPVIQSRVISMAFAWLIAGALFYGTMQAVIGWRATFFTGLVALGVGIFALGLAHDPWTAAAATALKGFGSGILNPGFIQLVLGRTTPATRGKALGLMTTAMYVGDLANPIVVAPFRAYFGMHGAFIALGAAVLLGTLVALLAGTGRRAAATPAASPAG